MCTNIDCSSPWVVASTVYSSRLTLTACDMTEYQVTNVSQERKKLRSEGKYFIAFLTPSCSNSVPLVLARLKIPGKSLNKQMNLLYMRAICITSTLVFNTPNEVAILKLTQQ